MSSRKPTNSKSSQSVTDLRIHRQQNRKETPLLTSEILPAGKYYSEIIAIDDATCASGKPAADVTYRFTGKDGVSVTAKIRYPHKGYHIEQLFEAMLDAGLPDGAHLTEAVGVQEEVEVIYAYEGALGKIKTRRPVGVAKQVPSSTKRRPSLGRVTAKSSYVEDEDEDEDEIEVFTEDGDLIDND